MVTGAVELVRVAWSDPDLATDRISTVPLLLDGPDDIDVKPHEDEVSGLTTVPYLHESWEAPEVHDGAALLRVHDLVQVEVVVLLLPGNADGCQREAGGSGLQREHDDDLDLQYKF